MATKTVWPEAIKPLLERYKDKPHPLVFRNTYQLLVMVVLSAQSTDDVVNALAPALFSAFPNMEALSRVTPQALFPYISKVRNFGHKASWLVAIAGHVRKDEHIPLTMDQLTELPGIGRKSANVILRETGRPPEGVIVDLHVVRVAPRLGIAKEEDPKKIEERLMKVLPRDEWDAGMAMSFLGREICRPKPECERCLMNKVCAYYAKRVKTGRTPAKKTGTTPKDKVKKRSGRGTK